MNGNFREVLFKTFFKFYIGFGVLIYRTTNKKKLHGVDAKNTLKEAERSVDPLGFKQRMSRLRDRRHASQFDPTINN